MYRRKYVPPGHRTSTKYGHHLEITGARHGGRRAAGGPGQVFRRRGLADARPPSRDMGQEGRVPPRGRGLRRRPRQRLEVPLHLLPERRRRLPDSVLHHAGVRRVAALLHGAGFGAVSPLRLPHHLEAHLPRSQSILMMLPGVGYAICLIDVYMGMYYNTIIGWAVYYLFASFRSELPWTSCNNPWNTPNCVPVLSGARGNSSTSPAREFFERSVLEQYKSDGLDRMGPIKWSLALCVLAVFLLVYFSLWKGVRSAGKAVWVTALAPYVVLVILLARGVSLPGAAEGIRYYLTPQWHKLGNAKVWIDAASQIFFSLGPGFGTLLALSSYNKFNNNCYRDAILTSSINCLTSFLAGFVIFSVLGYMAHVEKKSVAEVGLEGPGLVFIVYPEAIATMSGSVFWSIIFFLMLITLGLDSTFGGLEAMITALCDEYPRVLGRHREIFVAFLLVFVYICALPTTTYGGVYLVNLLNIYGPGISILFVVFVEAAGVCWFYGTNRFSRDIEKMLGHRPGIFWRVCWGYISPVFLLVIFIFSLLGYEDMLGDTVYPAWSISVGWVLTASSLLCIPLYIVYYLIKTPGTCLQRVKKAFKAEERPEEAALSINSNYGTGTHV